MLLPRLKKVRQTREKLVPRYSHLIIIRIIIRAQELRSATKTEKQIETESKK